MAASGCLLGQCWDGVEMRVPSVWLSFTSHPGGSDGKESVCNAGDQSSIPGVGKIPWKKEMTTHSRILVWRIPWTEEPGRLQSMESQRVGHNWATIIFTLHPQSCQLEKIDLD